MESHSFDVNHQELARAHAGWHAFTKFAVYGIINVVVLLVLMAIFLL